MLVVQYTHKQIKKRIRKPTEYVRLNTVVVSLTLNIYSKILIRTRILRKNKNYLQKKTGLQKEKKSEM